MDFSTTLRAIDALASASRDARSRRGARKLHSALLVGAASAALSTGAQPTWAAGGGRYFPRLLAAFGYR